MLAEINLGELLWSLLVIYLMVMYFVLVITVVIDIFRSDDLSGVGKAVWVAALLFFPFLTMLLYLVIRGQSMNERRREQVRHAQAEADDYIRTVAGSAGPASELEKAKALLDSGTIDAAEYDRLKGRILA